MSARTGRIISFFLEMLSRKTKEKLCNKCLKTMKIVKKRINTVRCTNKKCNNELKLIKKKPFYNNRLGYEKVLEVIDFLANGCRVMQISNLLGLSRKAVGKIMAQINTNLKGEAINYMHMIGGVNVIVEIDESKFGKRKYHRGHQVEGVWIMGLVERTERKRCILIPLENRKEQTLIEIIQRYVLPGTTIYTDGWRGYRNIGSYSYNHYMIYHNY